MKMRVCLWLMERIRALYPDIGDSSEADNDAEGGAVGGTKRRRVGPDTAVQCRCSKAAGMLSPHHRCFLSVILELATDHSSAEDLLLLSREHAPLF